MKFEYFIQQFQALKTKLNHDYHQENDNDDMRKCELIVKLNQKNEDEEEKSSEAKIKLELVGCGLCLGLKCSSFSSNSSLIIETEQQQTSSIKNFQQPSQQEEENQKDDDLSFSSSSSYLPNPQFCKLLSQELFSNHQILVGIDGKYFK